MLRIRALSVAVLLAALSVTSFGQDTPRSSSANRYRLQFNARELKGYGIRVTQVTPGGAATRMQRVDNPKVAGSLEVGDLVTAINGTTVSTMAEYYAALQQSNGRVQLRVRDHKTGRSSEWFAQGVAQHVASKSSAPVTNKSFVLGMRSIETPAGLRVQSIEADSPLRRLRSIQNPSQQSAAEVGDLVTAINGQPTPTFPKYFRAMSQAKATGGWVTVSLRDANTGLVRKWRTMAERFGGSKSIDHTSPSRPQLRKIHLLFCGLTNDRDLGPGCRVNLQAMQQLCSSEISSQYIAGRYVLEGSRCNASSILTAIDRIPASRNDTIFLYYSGHGAYDRSLANGDASGGHFFQFPNGDLMRRQVHERLRRKNARLTVFISDACNVPAFATPYFAPPGYPKDTTQQRSSRHRFSHLEKLLLEHQGDIDLNASARNEYGLINSSHGGWFTYVLARVLGDDDTWPETLQNLRRYTQAFYAARRAYLLADNDRTSRETREALQAQRTMTPTTFHFQITRDPYSSR